MAVRLIDLSKYTHKSVGVLAGRARGEAVRSAEKLDELDRDPSSKVVIKIPDWIFSVNSSFSLGLCTASIRQLGVEKFLEKYSFTGPNAEEVMADVVRKAQLSAVPLPAVRIA